MSQRNNLRGHRQRDRNLALAASDALQSLTTIPIETIKITARNGHLQLDGRVGAVCQRTVIEELTRALPGVKRVTNLLCVAADPEFAEARAVL